MFNFKNKNEKIEKLTKLVEQLLNEMKLGNFIEWSYILGNKKEIFRRNIVAGIGRGIGIGIGFTVITAIIIIILQEIVRLNIPIIGEYIADIVDIVENSR